MKTISLLFLVFFTAIIIAQEKMIAYKGTIDFEASVPLFEEVKAKNENINCTFNLENGEIKSTAFLKDFHFKIALMEKHFNESYVESHKYPKATFEGTIENFNTNIIGKNPVEFKLNGILKLHGKSKKISTVALIQKTNDGLEIKTEFNINSKEFNIKIPEILSMKVAETVTIKSEFLLQ